MKLRTDTKIAEKLLRIPAIIDAIRNVRREVRNNSDAVTPPEYVEYKSPGPRQIHPKITYYRCV